MHKRGLFIFRRDLRLTDNTGLLKAKETCETMVPIFIFTPEQVSNKNSYKSNNAVIFMIESLMDLKKQIDTAGGKLNTLYGDNITVLRHLIKELEIDCICLNADYTPYSIARDNAITGLCKKMKIDCIISHDQYLTVPGSVLNGSGEPYQKFTPYYNTAKKIKVPEPVRAGKIHFVNKIFVTKYNISLETALEKLTTPNPQLMVYGGRDAGVARLKSAVKTQSHYSSTRDLLKNYTSVLSAYIKFGCVSIREVYSAFSGNTDFIRELYWRDFYGNIIYSFPRVIGHSQKEKYDKIKWKSSPALFDAWCKGRTGFPVVDAGMRQMNTTGYMHNRCRMIVSSFLIKILHIDWRKGEKYFAEKLVDYDVASNNGGWQWSAGSGADSQQYNRIFNPYTQGRDYDPDCVYIKRWVEELKDVEPEDIHKWDVAREKYQGLKYPEPIVDYKKEREVALNMYTSALY